MGVLKELLKEVGPGNVRYWAEFRDGFEVCFKPISRDELRRIYRKNTRFTWNRRTHQREETVDEEGFRRDFLRAVLLDWRGLTVGKLRRWLPGLPLSGPDDQEIPFDYEDAELLAERLLGFENFLTTLATQYYELEDVVRTEAVENFGPSSGGG